MPSLPLDKTGFVIYNSVYSEISEIVDEDKKMAREDKNESCVSEGFCKVESLISVDERGQMVLPKETRERAAIHAGDKLALIAWEKDGKICCFLLIKAGNSLTWREICLVP